MVEVADTTLVTDRFKAQLYAQAGIPTYWLVNLAERQVEVMCAPQVVEGKATYGRTTTCGPAESLAVVVGGQAVGQICVGDLFA